MTDPVVRLRKMRDRPAFYWTVIGFVVTAVSLVLLLNKVSHESSTRTKQLQDVICGVYVPIAHSPLPPKVTVLGKTIVLATRHGALELHCPGIR
jgi:hypothetical protein